MDDSIAFFLEKIEFTLFLHSLTFLWYLHSNFLDTI
jgi:hypothetical protein